MLIFRSVTIRRTILLVSLGIVLASTLTLSMYQWIEHRMFQNVFTDLAADQLALADRVAAAERFAIAQSLRTASLLSILILIPICAIAAIRIVRPIYSVTVEAMNLTQIKQPGDELRANEAEEIKTALRTFTRRIDRVRSELDKERARALLVVNSLDEGIAVADYNGLVSQVNPSVEQVLPLKPGGTLPEPLLSLARDAIAMREQKESEMAHEGRVYSLRVLPLVDEATAICVMRDATEAARLEQTRRDYIANVSHELRSPLTALRCMIEPLRDGLIKEESRQSEVYDILLTETMRLSRLVDDMLELSRLQSGKLALEKIRFDLKTVIYHVLDTVEPRMVEKNLTLTRHVDIIPECFSNPDRVEQILMALVDNAIKFTPQGGAISVSAFIPEQPQSGSNIAGVVVEVSDSGGGIDPEDLPHVFDRFYKADKAHSGGGTGLGLAIARELVELLGGTINANNNQQGGAAMSFSVTL